MKKLLSILFVFISVTCFSQTTFPLKQGLGNANANVQSPGTVSTLTGFTWALDFVDTITANTALYVKFTPGIVIRCGTSFFVRNNAASAWVSVGGGGGGGSTNTSLGTSFPVAITGTNNVRSIRDSLYFKIDSSITGTLRGRVDTANMFPVIRSTITAASITRQPVGIIIDQPFTAGTIPSGWSQQTGAATISYGGGNGLSMSGGNGSLTDNFVKTQFNSISNNYYYTIPFSIVTKPTDYNGWIGFSKFGIQPMYVRARYAGFTDSMRLVLNINGNDVDSTRRIAMANGNNYSIKISVSNNTVFYGITLLSGTSIVTTKEHVYSIPIGYITIAMPCIGNPGFNVGGGSYNKITFQQYDQDIYGADVMIIGTSISQGYYLASFQNNWISKSFDGSEKVYTNYGSSQATMGSLINALPEIYLNHPRVVGVEAGTNDICDGTFRTRMNGLIDSLQAHGIEVFWVSDFTPNACKDTIIINVCNEQGIVYLNPFADLTSASLPDGIHPNDFGAMNIAKYLKSKAPQYFGKVGAIEQQSLDGLRNVLVTSPTTGDVLGYNITTKQWNNIPPGSLFILNQTLVAQTANSWINGFMSASAGAGIGDVATSAYMLRIREAGVAGTTDFKGILITNAGASTSSKDAVIGQSGSNGFGITGWANKLVIEGQAAGITLSGYGGDIRYQIGAARTDVGIITSTGFGFGTISPSHTVTVNGQVKVFAPQAGDIDSIATWKDGVLSATLASSIVPTFQQTLTAGSTLTTDNTVAVGNHLFGWTFSGLSTNGMSITSSTTAASAANILLRTAVSGTNGTSGITTTAASFENSHNGTTSTNVAAQFIAQLGTTDNYAIIVPAASGKVGFGTANPTHDLTLNGQFKIFAPQAGDIDSLATWKDGVLSSTLTSAITGILWNNVASPTGDQALTFAVGNSSTWTNQNTTEDMFTVNDATTTTSSLFSINRTSTAITTGNNLMELISSGAMGAGTTANGLVITMTNTGTTSVLRGLNVSVSGATTNTAAIFTGNVGMGTPTPGVQLEVNGTIQGNTYQTTSTAVNGVFQTAATTGAVGSSSAPVLLPNNATGSAFRVQTNGTVNGTPGAGTDYGQMIIGKGLWIEAGSGTHPRAFSLAVLQPLITNAAGATDTLVGLYVAGAPTGVTAGTATLGMEVNSGDVLFKTGRLGVGLLPTSMITLPAGTATANTAPLQFTTGTSETVARAGVMEYTTPQLFFTNGGAVRQELFQGQQSRVSTQYDNTTTTLGNVTGLTASMAAGKIYRFEAILYTTSNVAGGIKVAIANSGTTTSVIYEALVTDAGVSTQGRTTTMGTAVAGVTAVTNSYVRITGLVTANSAGNLTVQAAQNANVGTTSVLTGSTFVITEIP